MREQPWLKMIGWSCNPDPDPNPSPNPNPDPDPYPYPNPKATANPKSLIPTLALPNDSTNPIA